MMIDDLNELVMKFGVWNPNGYYYVKGCRLLEHIVDVPGFVSLLRGFKRRDHGHKTYVGFVDDFSDPVRHILGGSVVFGFSKFDNNIRITVFHGARHWLYYW